MSARAVSVTLVCLILCACGYIGEPQYPALRIPNRVSDLTAIQRGDHLEVYFTIPPLTTEGLAIGSIGGIDLRAGPNPQTGFQIEPWAEAATRIETPPPTKPQTVTASIPAAKFVGQEVIVAVRLANNKGRYSEWSNLVTVRVEKPLPTPAGLTAQGVAEGVRLTWNAPGESSFRIFRGSDKEPQPTQIGLSEKPEYVDTTTSYGVKYSYFVQGVAGLNESETAGPAEVTTEDKFAPAIPAGVTATSGIDAIELAWQRNTERDFRAYRVYRAAGDGTFERIADSLEAPNYSDRKIESGKRYRYAISAIDQAGNESDKSQPVEATAP